MVLEQGGDGDGELLDTLFRSLGKPERRRLLAGLLTGDPDQQILIPEDVHVGEKPLERLTLEMRHNHLPMLEEAGLIRWDRDAGVARAGQRFGEVRALIATFQANDPTLADG